MTWRMRDRATDDGRRRLLQASLAAACLGTGVRSTLAAPRFDAVVGPADRAHPAPSFASIGQALASAPRDGRRPFRILVSRGVWHEKLVIDKPNIQLIGADRTGSVLSFDAAAGMPRPDGQPWGTWGCATVIVRAPDFQARNLTLQNAFDYVGNLKTPRFEPIGPNGAQAVALMLDAGADRSLLQDVDILGHQDTLFADAGRSLFRRCRVTGSVDFVFGAGRAVLQDCRVVSRFRPGKERQGYVAVPSTPSAQAHGLTFVRCRLEREPRVPDASVALGRAWRPGREFADGKYGDPAVLGSAAFLACWMDAHIDPKGWDAMAYTARDGRRVMLEPAEARLFEYDSRGPGAHRSPTRRLLSPDQAADHAIQRVLAGWMPV
jgi:pectinesterase